MFPILLGKCVAWIKHWFDRVVIVFAEKFNIYIYNLNMLKFNVIPQMDDIEKKKKRNSMADEREDMNIRFPGCWIERNGFVF